MTLFGSSAVCVDNGVAGETVTWEGWLLGVVGRSGAAEGVDDLDGGRVKRDGGECILGSDTG